MNSSQNLFNQELRNLLIEIPSFPAEKIIDFIELNKEKIDWEKGDFLQMAIKMTEHYTPHLVKYFLVNKIYSPNHVSRLTGTSALDFLIEKPDTLEFKLLAKILIDNGADVNAVDIKSSPLINKVVFKNSVDYVNLFVSNGANCNTFYDEKTLLQVSLHNLPFSYLSSNFYNANTDTNMSPYTSPNLEIIKILLANGAQIKDEAKNFNAIDTILELEKDMHYFPTLKQHSLFKDALNLVKAHEEKLKLENTISSSSLISTSQQTLKI